MSSHDDMLEMVALFAVGALNKREARQVAVHLHGCTECQHEYNYLEPAVTATATSAEKGPEATTCARMKARIMRAVAPSSQKAPKTSARVWPAYLATAASLLFALATTIANIALNGQLREAQIHVNELHAQLATTSRNGAAQRAMLADLVAGDAKHFAVPGGEVIRRGDHVYLAMRSLPAPPKGHTYQAWILAVGAKAVTPSIRFVPSAAGIAVISLPEHASAINAIAVSIEPDGGSKAPTTKPLFIQPIAS